MRIRLLSDLHLEFCPWDPPRVAADVVVLAGDIHNGLAGIRWAAEQFSVPVIYVPGNHEYDGHDIIKLRERWRAPEWPDHVHVLDDRAVEIAGVRFVGSTLWTDFNLIRVSERRHGRGFTHDVGLPAYSLWIGRADA